ncbi:hypothetical protein ACFX2B_013999 [Malus domestica]
MDSYPRIPLQRSNPENLDRFIPNRAALDYDYAHFMVTGGERKSKENPSPYQKMLEESKNILAVAIGNTVYLWNASNSSIAELVTIDEEDGPVTSVSWACDGWQIAVGLNNSFIQLWDSISLKRVGMFRGGRLGRVGSLAWNKNILTTGGMDGRITNNDPRVRYHIVGTFKGHQQEISGLKWPDSGQHLASGGNYNLLFIWDRSTISLNSPRKWLHRLEDHIAAIKALAWCPFQENLLASGGGEGDQCIEFWNTRTGLMLELG